MGPFSHKIDRDRVIKVIKGLLKFFSFPWLLEISYAITKLTLSKISFFHHFICQFINFFSVVNVPTTTVRILMSTLERRRKILLKVSVHENNRCAYTHYSLYCLLLSFVGSSIGLEERLTSRFFSISREPRTSRSHVT